MAKALNPTNPEAFDQASPLGKIPAIKIANYYLADSAVICSYLDKKFPNRRAFTQIALKRMEKRAGLKIMPITFLLRLLIKKSFWRL